MRNPDMSADIIAQPIPVKESPEPFPYMPPQATLNMQVRMELLRQLDLWENNDPEIAKGIAAILVNTLTKQFSL